MNFSHLGRAMRASLREVAGSRNFCLAVILCFIALFAELVPIFSANTGEYGDAYYFNISLHFGYYIYAAPLVCAFASGDVFCSDWEAGFYRLRLIKCGRREYQCGLWLGTTLGGGLALFLGVSLFGAACAVLFGPQRPAEVIMTVDGWLPLLQDPNGNLSYMLANALLALLFGMVWSGAGLFFSLLSPNRATSYLMPFILCFCGAIFLPASLRPLEMLVQMSWQDFHFPRLIAYQTALYAAFAAGCLWISDRRLFHE